MKNLDLVGSAVSNSFRSKTRTLLTILAIFVGAFTLTLTSGLGTGINDYIDSTVTSIGAADAMTVTKPSEAAAPFASSDLPAEYDPDAVSIDRPGPPGATVLALTPDDLDALAGIDGVLTVDATKAISADYIAQSDGTKYVVTVGSLVTGQTVQLAAGTDVDDAATEFQLVLPVSYVDALGFDDNESAVGETVSLGITDAQRVSHVIEATIVGVAEESVVSPMGPSIVPNENLTNELFATQNLGVPADEQERYAMASISFAPGSTDEQIDALKDDLTAAGYSGSTVADQLGTVKTVIDAIVLVLNAFGVIALLAASFGIVNTLYMSVQERTREIGLMKAMGMGSGKVFGLFSLEAVFIGFLGSAIGVGIAMIAGTALSSVLAGELLSGLPGLTLIAFDPISITVIILIVTGIAFLAGTLPAARAARADPVESLRYE